MKVGWLVRHIHSPHHCQCGIIVRTDGNGVPGAMVLWEHGEICYSPWDELEVLSEGR